MKTIIAVLLLAGFAFGNPPQTTVREYSVPQPSITVREYQVPQAPRRYREVVETYEYAAVPVYDVPAVRYRKVYAAPAVVYAPSYGAYLGNGQYATPSGRPVAPGIIPGNGPVRGLLRSAAGYDPVR